MCAFIEALALLVDISPTQMALVHEQLKAMAIDREHVCGADHPLVQEFWEIYEFLEGNEDKIVNHSVIRKLLPLTSISLQKNLRFTNKEFRH